MIILSGVTATNETMHSWDVVEHFLRDKNCVVGTYRIDAHNLAEYGITAVNLNRKKEVVSHTKNETNPYVMYGLIFEEPEEEFLFRLKYL